MLSQRELVVNFLEAATAYRVDDCLALLAPDATWWVLGDPRQLKVAGSKTRAQIAMLIRGLAKFIPTPMTLTIHGITADVSRVAVEAECMGTWRNGATYHNFYHFLFEVEAGLIRRIREYMDTLHLFDTLTERTHDSSL